MLWIFGLPIAVLLGRFLGALDGADDVAEPGDEADHEEREHEPRRGAELAIEPHAEQQADHDRDAELEPDRARRERIERATRAASCGIGEDRAGLAHGISMRLLHEETVRHFAAMARARLHC